MSYNQGTLITILAVALVTAGCSKDEQKKAKPGQELSQPAAGLVEARAESKAGSMEADRGHRSGFAVLPKNADFVVGMNFSKIMSSALWAKFVAPEIADDVSKVEKDCGMNPFAAIETMIFGGNSDDADNGILVIKGLTEDQVIKCGSSMRQGKGKKVTFTKEGKYTKVSEEGQKPRYAGWLDEKTMVASDKAKNPSDIDAIMSARDGLDGNAAMMDLLGNVDTSGAAYVVFGKSSSDSAVKDIKFEAAYLSILADTGLKIDLGLRQANADEAKTQLANLTREMDKLKQSPFGQWFGKTELKTSGSDVIIQLSLSEAELMQIKAMAQGFLANANASDMLKMFGN